MPVMTITTNSLWSRSFIFITLALVNISTKKLLFKINEKKRRQKKAYFDCIR